jgi:hypothetical protein
VKIAEVEKRVRYWQRLFSLEDCRLSVVLGGLDNPDAYMATEWSRGYMNAVLHVARRTLKKPRRTVDNCIIHELLHLRFVPVDDALEHAIGEGTVFHEFRRYMERAIDGLANCIEVMHRAKV